MEIPKPRLKRRNGVPFGGQFDLNLKEQGLVGSGTSLSMLIDRIVIYRKANAIEVGLGLSDLVEAEVCKKYPAECHTVDAATPDPNKRLGWKEVLAGTKVMLRRWFAGKPTESAEEAERRAGICMNCPWNTAVTWGCGGMCGEFKEFVEHQLGNPRTKYGDGLKSCGICGCYLNTAVFVPLEMQWAETTPEQRKQFAVAHARHNCWKYLPE